MTKDGADNVVAKQRIRQSPLSEAPDVPRGTSGHIEDEADGYLWVDFGEPYGAVACDAKELI